MEKHSTLINNIEFDLLENGLDFILSSLDPIIQSHNDAQLKYSLLHLSAGVELILKERLRKEHWTLIFENINNANSVDLSSGDFQSVNLESSILRLENVCEIEISDKDKKYLRELKKRRNKIEHFAFKELDTSIKSLASKVLSIILSFIKENFDNSTLSGQSKSQIEKLRLKMKDFSEFVKLRWSQIKEMLKTISESHEIIKCPQCFQEAFVLNDDLTCLFCGYTDIANKVAENYVESVLGKSYFMCIKDGDNYPIDNCPECSETTLVEIGNNYLCFNCYEKYSTDSIQQCEGCSELYLPDDDDFGLCDSCINTRFESFGEK
jgi:hypothetical protein